MTTVSEHITHLRQRGWVEMDATGHWRLSQGGKDHLDQLDIMHALDDRPEAEQFSSAWRTPPPARPTGQSTPPKCSHRGDDGPGAAGDAGGV